MQLSTSLLSILLFATALVGAAPTSPSNSLLTKRSHATCEPLNQSFDFAIEAFKKCKELGIDPFGEMPTDYTSDNGKVIHFKKESLFAIWMAAQSAIGHAGLHKRQDKTNWINIITWTNPNHCNGDGHWYYGLQYGENHYSTTAEHNNYSLQITHGHVDPNVATIQLRKWKGGKSTECDDLFFDVSGKIGCATQLLPYNCVVLDKVPPR
ncbi:hypothetical protein K440DRAFT_663497 [Wilcoxina mikolae CBS 423.85]|nr:hypothetical protein K440DRAFT_663497 [Wilcoxina mikolae CBS 423.85]